MSMSISLKAIVPELAFNSEFIRFQIMRTLQTRSAPDVQRLFRQTVNGWRDKPNFLQKFTDTPSRLSAEIWPSNSNKAGKIYNLVNAGAPPHHIAPRKKKILRFQPGYSSATRPRVLSSRAFTRSGEYVVRTGVNHPGFEAREFDQTIVEQYADTFYEDIQDAVRVAVVMKG